MDIKPVKKRRKRQVNQPSRPIDGNQPLGQKNITVRSKLNPLNQVGKNTQNKITKLKKLLTKNVFLIAVFALLCVLYLPTSDLIDNEQQYQDLINQSSSVEIIIDKASYMPQKFFLLATNSYGLSSVLLLKILTFIFCIFVVYLFYKASLRWLGRNTALISTFLFSSSSWMILSSQSLNFNNIYLIFIPLVIFLNYLLTHNKNSFRVFLAALLFSITLYSPGMVWPILGFIALLPIFMQKILVKYNLSNIWILLIATSVMILPLFASFILRPDNFSYLLVGDGQTTIYAFLQNLQNSLEALFLNGIPNNDLWLVGTPVFNYLTSLLFMFGIVFLFANKGLYQRFNFLAVSLIFSLLTIAFVGLPALSLIIPAMYLVAGFGIKFLLGSWYRIFPSNPVARNVGLSLVIFIILLSVGYNITRYYIAWPKAHENISALSSEKTI